jgi:methyl-accepting chemotaxis protein
LGRKEDPVRKLKVWQKLGIIGLALGIPLALTTKFLGDQQASKINFARAELNGLVYLRPLSGLYLNAWAHKAAEHAVLDGNGAAEGAKTSSEAAVAAGFDQLGVVDAQLGSALKTDAADLVAENRGSSQVSALRTQWQAILQAPDAAASDDGHAKLLGSLGDLIRHVGDSSKLILDPDIDTYYTMDAFLLQEPQIIDGLNRSTEQLDALSATGTLTPQARSSLAAQVTLLREHDGVLVQDLQTAFRGVRSFSASHTLEPSLSPVLSEVSADGSRVVTQLQTLATAPSFDPSVTATISANARAAIDSNSQLWSRMLDQEAIMLTTRKNRAVSTRRTELYSVLAVLIVAAGLMIWVARRLVKDVRSVASAARKLATGDLQARAEVGNDDEIGRLAADFNEMVEKLEQLSRQVRGGATELTAAATEILSSVSEHTASAAQQSAAIRQISATVEELRATAELSLERALEVAQQGQTAVEIATEGTEAMTAIRAGMDSIRQSAEAVGTDILALAEQTQQIGEITALVSDLADQSNLLALNANIEAAKAGEQGKGFAVVATEVRNLAEQSKRATAQVHAILADIQSAANTAVLATEAESKLVENGSTLSTRSAEIILQLRQAIADAAQAAQQIAESVHEQKIGIDQIAQAISDVNQGTVQFVAGAQQSQATAQSLNGLAGSLQHLTDQYKVGVG